MVPSAHCKTDRLPLLVDRASGSIEWGLANHDSLGGAPMSEVTEILGQIVDGDGQAAEKLLPLVYDELRKLAAAKMAKEDPGQTLQPTALVHEAYIRLVDVKRAQNWGSQGHFFAAAAEAMRRILVENARRKQRAKHGGDLLRLPLAEISSPPDNHNLIALDEALTCLAAEDSLAAKIVELRYFAGLTHEETAETLHITVYRERQKWTYARAWLRHAVSTH
jgi:RNA polymerase sigma factor (TIGR02999 family)